MLDTLISLAKSFPSQFLPSKAKETPCEIKDGDDIPAATAQSTKSSTSDQPTRTESSRPDQTDFWEILNGAPTAGVALW